ncbi:MAG TPA: ABC transporter ATP-binding protein [Solirubrobacteraceae bacterium]|nr:ABC transporter ATP-binding protein [Solirubrobacteraceae bacterium]
MIRLHAVSKSYGTGRDVPALRHVDLHIRAGERVAVMGPSGSGKSTLLNLCCGLDEPDSGSVEIGGVELAGLADDARTQLRRERIGMVFQTFNLMPTLSALENVALPLRLAGAPRAAAERRALGLLERVQLAQRASHRPDQLSGGERQRVALVRALIHGPELLLADEPTGNLDSATGGEVLRELERLREQCGATLVLVTHNPDAAAYCDRLLILQDGRVLRDEARAGAPGSA